MAFTLTLMLIYYLNFKYAFSTTATTRPSVAHARGARARSSWPLAFVGVLVAAGFRDPAMGEWLGDRTTDEKRWTIGGAGAAAGADPAGNRVTAPRSHETLARDFAIDMLESVEPFGILITARRRHLRSGSPQGSPRHHAGQSLVDEHRLAPQADRRRLFDRPPPTRSGSRRPTPWRELAAGQLGEVQATLQQPTNAVLSLSELQIDSLADVVLVQRDPGRIRSRSPMARNT